MKNLNKKIIIIGAGPGGLTAGMILAHRGFQVQIIEKNSTVGGRNAALQMGPYRFDTGPTFLMMSFILKEMFAEAGENIDKYLKLIDLDPFYHLSFTDSDFYPSADHQKTEEQIKKHYPGSEIGWSKFLLNERKRYLQLFPCLQKDYTHWWAFFRLEFIKAIPLLGIGRSLFSNLGRYFSAEKLRLLFTFQSKYLGMSPWECPAGFTIIPYIEHTYGIQHVVGGLNRISQVMADICRAKDVHILLQKKVNKIITDHGRVIGVQLADGQKLYADEIIINADFAHAANHLFPEKTLKKYSPTKLAKKKYSCSTFMLYLGLDKKYDLPHHNIYFAHDYRANVDDIFRNKKLSSDLSFYIQNASITDNTLAPVGHSAMYVLVPVPNNFSNLDWTKETNNFRQQVLATIIQRTGLKDLAQHIVQEKIITPQDWSDDYAVYQGATFNLAHNLSQMLYFRPRNKFEELDNCYLTGGGTHPGSGLPTIYESARITANLISKKYRVSYKKPSDLHSKNI